MRSGRQDSRGSQHAALDALIRLRRLAAVVDRAAASLKKSWADGKNTLKIFMAEYANETYAYDHAVQIFEELNVMFRHADFKDWLIVPGTVVWNWKDDKGRLYRNSAIYIRGNADDSLRLVEKDVPSKIDGVPNPYAKNRPYNPYIQDMFEAWHFRKDRIFEIGGVRCGLEVCLDYEDHPKQRVLQTVLTKWRTNEGTAPDPELRLHLLTAGGMELEPGSVAARTNGYILRNNGFSNPPCSELRKVQGYRFVRDASTKSTQHLADLSAGIREDGLMSSAGLNLTGKELVPMFGGD